MASEVQIKGVCSQRQNEIVTKIRDAYTSAESLEMGLAEKLL